MNDASEASGRSAAPEGAADRAARSAAQPDGLHLGPVDSPRFATPPFARQHVLPVMGPRAVERSAEELDAGGGPTDGDGALSEVPELDALEAQIDADQIDEFASRMASNRSLSVGTNDRVVEMLLRRGEVDEEQVRIAKQRRDEQHPEAALWRVLATLDEVDEATVYGRAARIYAFEVVDLDERDPDLDFVRSRIESFEEEVQERLLDLGVVPYRQERGRDGRRTVYFLTHDPMRPEVHRTVRQLGVGNFELQYAPETAVNTLVSEALPRDNEYLERLQEESAVDLGQSFEEEENLVDEERLEEEINRSTLINLFEATLVEAVREGASDIHIYPNANKEVEIHFRMNGQLNHWHTEDRVHPEALLSVVKDNTMEVDRFERDAAQDGFIQRDVDGTRIRYRVSIMPIASSSQDINSESVVIRVLDDRKVITDLGKLGLGPRALDRFEHAINQPYGMVILTGPTGSGKSTTLVAALHEVIGPEENVLTVEDPVEYIIEGARQIRLSDKLKLKDALRSILRHDPDTVMVGEMRDKETAEIAIKLANTGHLTFSTLHTNDAPSAVSRLYKMGIEPFLIAYAINLVVAQRLIRTLCPACKRPHTNPDPILLEQLGFTDEQIEEETMYEANTNGSCERCGGTGYDGRRAIAEALHFSREIRHMIVEADDMVDEGGIREHAQTEDGMRSLQASARQVVLRGETSVDEMMRVVAS
jgi:type IV pilus assembly protein PilB